MICMLKTHFPNHALRIAHKVLLMAPSGGHQVGLVHDILTEQAVRECFEVDTVFSDIAVNNQIHRALFPVSVATPKSDAGAAR